MTTPLLTTKLFIPPTSPNLVPRPRLIERLNEGITHKLILICAPAGFGKTTLLSNWIAGLDLPVAWVSLDRGDNDRTSFLIYLVAALQTLEAKICGTVLEMLLSPQPPAIESVLTELINQVATLSQDFVLVLDDYQVVEEPTIDEALAFLLDHIPPVMHLVIASRSDPMLPISRLRGLGKMTEIRSADLRFSSQEATHFLNRVMGLALSDNDIASLEIRTEGWIAGLQLAGLSIKNRVDPTEFISAFAGDDRYIIDYLVDEVLSQRPQGTTDFLQQTSILNRLCGPLCDAVTDQAGGQNILEKLMQANLFIFPLDNQRRWYRYHHLFADVLHKRLIDSTSSEAIRSIHQRASQWYQENGFLVEAVEHALAAEDFDTMIRQIETGSMELLMRGQQNLLLNWQARLPRKLVASHPRLCMTIAWAWLSTGKTQEAEECLQLLEQSLGTEMGELFSEVEGAEEIEPSIRLLLVEIAVIRIELAIEAGDIPLVFKLSQHVLPYLEDEDVLHQDDHLKNLRSVVYFVLGLAYKISGKLSEAGKALSKAARLGQDLGNVYIAAGSIGRLASVQSMQGHLSQAESTCQRGLKLVKHMVGKPPMYGLIHAELGNLLYERNDLEAALYHLQAGIDLAKPWGFLEAFIPGYTGLARVRAAQGAWEGAFAALDELEALGGDNPAMVMPAMKSLRALLCIALGKVDAANRWAVNTGLNPEGEIDFQRLGEWVAYARVLIARRAYGEVVNLLTRMVTAAEAGGWFGKLVELRVLLALVHEIQGDSDQAMIAIEQALISAEPEGYVRVFVDEGDPMKKMLHEAQSRGIASDYIPKLLAAFETDHVQVGQSSVALLIEPFSARELEVLRLLKSELSGPEIAAELTIALSTLRTHTQNIYSKLGVSNRRAAVRKAKELNLK